MSTPNLTEDQLIDRLRDADARAERMPSQAVWERVDARLSAPATASPLRVVHRANHSRMRLLMSVAACLLAVFGLAWYFTSGPDDGAVLSEVDIQRTVERSQLEGALELEGERAPLRRSIYDGVAVKVGELSTDALQVCEAC